MLKKRIIPCLDIQGGRVVKGIGFEGLRDMGDPIALAQRYDAEGADELVFLDISATLEERATLSELVRNIAATIQIPFTVGGGIRSVNDAKKLLRSGADKISINSAALERPELITELAAAFGNQCVVVAIDVKTINGVDCVFSHGGKKETHHEALNWALEVERLGAGEILLTSMNQDGAQTGFAISLTQKISQALSIPVIGSGGAGTVEDFTHLFKETEATGALAAGIFHTEKVAIAAIKNELYTQKIPVRWNPNL